MILFVYGSLRKGQYNHVRYGGMDMRRLVFLGMGKTVPAFTLVSFGSYPGLFAAGKTSVVGELYEIDPAHQMAKNIEMMEVGAGYLLTDVELTDGRVVKAYVQRGAIPSWYAKKVVEGGDWADACKPSKKMIKDRIELELMLDHEDANREQQARSKPAKKQVARR